MRARPQREAMERPARNGSLVVGGGFWRWLVVGVFIVHGLVHMMGFSAAWRLGGSARVASVPTFPAGLTAGSPVVLALGALWLVAMAGFLSAAVGLALHAAWWKAVATMAAALSLMLCLAWWNDAVIGVIINVAILAGLTVQARSAHARQPKGRMT